MNCTQFVKFIEITLCAVQLTIQIIYLLFLNYLNTNSEINFNQHIILITQMEYII